MVETNPKRIIEACRKALRQNENCAPEVVRKIVDGLNERSLAFAAMQFMHSVGDQSLPITRRQELEKLGSMVTGYEPITSPFTTGQILTLSGAIDAYKNNPEITPDNPIDLDELARRAQEQLPAYKADQDEQDTPEAIAELEKRKKAKITEAVKLLKEIGKGKYARIIDGESAPKVLQSVAKPEFSLEGATATKRKTIKADKKRAVETALAPYILADNRAKLEREGRKLAKGNKTAAGNYLVALANVLNAKRVDKLLDLAQRGVPITQPGDITSEDIGDLTETLRKNTEMVGDLDEKSGALDIKIQEALEALTNDAQEINEDIKQERTNLRTYRLEAIKAIGEKARGLYALERKLDGKTEEIGDVGQRAHNLLGKRIEAAEKGIKTQKESAEKALDKKKKVIQSDAEKAHKLLGKRIEAAENGIKTQKESAKNALDKQRKAIQTAGEKAHQILGDRIKSAKTVIEKQEARSERDLVKKSTAIERTLEQKAKGLQRVANQADKDLTKRIEIFQRAVEKTGTEEQKILLETARAARDEIKKGQNYLEGYRKRTLKAIDRRERKLYTLEGRIDTKAGKYKGLVTASEANLGKIVNDAEKKLDNEIARAKNEFDKRIQRKRKGPRKRTGLKLVTLAALGALGVYALTKKAEEQEEPEKEEKTSLITPKPRWFTKAYNTIELTKDGKYGAVLLADGKPFYKNPIDRKDPRFYPVNVVEKMEAGESYSRAKWIALRTKEFAGGADLNRDRQKDLVDSNGWTYVSNPIKKKQFKTRR